MKNAMRSHGIFPSDSLRRDEMQRTSIAINADVQLNQHKSGFSFGTDALLLSAFLPIQKNATAVELCAGSGVISLLALKTEKFEQIHAVEIQEAYACPDGVIAQNAKQNGLQGRLIAHLADARQVKAADFGGEAKTVFANPPYLAMGAGRSGEDTVREAARRELHGTIVDFCACANRLLKYGGAFYVVYRPDRLCDLICALRANDLEPKQLTLVQQDRDHEPFAVLIEARKGGKAALHTDVLCLYDENGAETQQYQKIKQEGVFS
jgi:tRNA1(Val) A37 N6-methylase TrmN6